MRELWICPKRVSLNFWAQLLHAVHSCSNSAFPEIYGIIEQEAFLKCTSLQEVCIPPSLLHIARRAFAGRTQLRAVRKKGKSQTWRGTHARLNAFDKCEQLDKPQWLRFLPPNVEDQWREDFQEAHTLDRQRSDDSGGGLLSCFD